MKPLYDCNVTSFIIPNTKWLDNLKIKEVLNKNNTFLNTIL